MSGRSKRHSTYAERKVDKHNREVRLACKKIKEEGNPYSQAKPKKSLITLSKTGMLQSRSDTPQVAINMRSASTRGSGNKPSMPKLPWHKD